MNIHFISQTLRPVPGSRPLCGLAVYGGRLSSASKKQKPNWGWISTKFESLWAGITISWYASWRIFFFGISKSDWEKKAPSITLSQLRVLFEAVLPLRHKDVEIAIEIVKWVQARNHRAYLSHRKRKLKKLSLQSEVAL